MSPHFLDDFADGSVMDDVIGKEPVARATAHRVATAFSHERLVTATSVHRVIA